MNSTKGVPRKVQNAQDKKKMCERWGYKWREVKTLSGLWMSPSLSHSFCFVLLYLQCSFLWNKYAGSAWKVWKKYIKAAAWSDRSDIPPDVCGGWDSLSKKWTMHCCLHQRILNTPNRNVHREFKQLLPICAHRQLGKSLSHQHPGRKTTTVPYFSAVQSPTVNQGLEILCGKFHKQTIHRS